MDKKLINQIKYIILNSGKIAITCREKGLQIDIKTDKSPVTNADKEISEYIFSELSQILPDVPVICEERPVVNISDAKLFWLIDPIDGTRSFINNSDNFTVNIALIENKKPKYGFIYIPSKSKLYYTDENNQLIIEEYGSRVDAIPHNKNGCVAVVSSHNFNFMTEDYLAKNNICEIIAVPSSVKLCMIAEGAGDVYPKFSDTMEWDIAAGHALIKAVGGELFTMNNESMQYAKEDFLNSHFIATNKRFILDI